MKIIWFGMLIEIILLSIIKSFVVDCEGIAIIAVLMHIVFTMLVLMSYKDRTKILFLGAFLARAAFMFWDLYARHIYPLPNSGADTEMYYGWAVNIADDISILNQNIQGGIYSKIIGTIFHFIGPERMMGQYINVLLGLSVVFIVYRIFLMLKIDSKAYRMMLLVTAFFPNSLVMSAIFLREIFPTFFVALSLFYFIKWFIKPRTMDMVLSYVMISLGSMFHSGVIGIAVGYIFGYLFFKKEHNTFRFTGRTIASFLLIVIISSLGVTLFEDQIFGKFKNIDDIGDIYSTANSRYGDSAYLKGMTINSPLQLALFGPVKSLFFFTAPLPMNWRGSMDIFTFFTDSSLYLVSIVYFIKNRKKFKDRRTLVISLVVMLIGAGIIFGIGVSNAGTAVRHRQKLVPVFLVFLGVMMDEMGRLQLR